MSVYQTARRIALDWLPPVVSRVISERVVVPLTPKPPPPPEPVSKIRVLKTLQQVDEAIARCDEAERVSDAAMRAEFETFEYRPDLSDIPPDPYSDAYRDYQWRLYHAISARDSYVSTVNEIMSLDVERYKRFPFPYYTGSAFLTGEQLMMIGFALSHMNLKPNARVIEFGPGCGNFTIELAKLGHDVTAVDIVQGHIDIVEARAKQLERTVHTAVGDMLTYQPDGRYDAVIFYECFHHCSDHLRMLDRLHEFIHDDGMVVFAGEPITDWMPYPWGVRTDGISMWTIRKHGWLELGFQPGYFRDALARHGWTSNFYQSVDVPKHLTVIARKADRIQAVGGAR
jgi:2-polyprenyl-3-methyl-5-hydroxy-6-metoxy-1,4-benzoquinol methylase